MNNQIKVVVTPGPLCVTYEGLGREGRRYCIQRRGAEFIASLVAGVGQHIAASGKSPLEALRRAESAQHDWTDQVLYGHHKATP